ncbi:ATP-binding protein [Streptomyces canus]|uniref:ATP-binding protein n=1 Tax=Streptomyces canus TaxID=58343 RepID=UPI003CF03557
MVLVRHQEDQKRGSSGSVRGEELQRLFTALDSIGSNTGRIVEVVGAPGTGKSRLVSDLTQEACQRNVKLLSGRCVDAEREIPFHPFVHALSGPSALDLIDRLPADSAQLLRGAFVDTPSWDGSTYKLTSPERVQFRKAVRTLLAHSAGPGMVLVLDDFHHADPDSVELLDYLVRFPVPRLLLVIAHRNRQASARLRSSFAHGVALGTVERVELGALSLSQSSQILGLPPYDERLRHLYRQSDGNPAYLLMLAHGDPEASSKSVDCDAELGTDMLLGELAALSTDEKTVVTAAAVIGDRFDLAALTAVAELDSDEVRRSVAHLLGRDILRPVGTRAQYTFRHPVVRRLVCAHTDPLWRLSAHRRALRVLLDRNAPVASQAAHVECLLDHLEPQDLPTLVRVADHAVRSDPSSSVRWLRAMLHTLPDDGRHRAERLQLSLKLACALMAAGRAAESRELYLRTLDQIPPCPPRVRASAVILCAQLENMLGHHVEAGRLLEDELAQLPSDTSTEAVELILARQFVMSMQRRLDSTTLMERCVRLSQQHEDRANEAGALAALALERLFNGDVGGAEAAATACASIVDMLPDAELGEHVDYLAMLGGAEVHLDRFAQAKRHFTRGVSIARASRAHHHVPVMLLGLSTVYHQIGPLESALHTAAEAGQLARVMGADHVLGLTLARQAACVSATEGHAHPEKAVALAEEALGLLSSDCFYRGIEAVLIFADAVLTAGDPHGCRALLLDAGHGPNLPRVPLMQRARCFEKLTAAAVAAGDTAAAATWARSAHSAALSTGVPSHGAFAMSAKAHVLSATGDHEAAMLGYRSAADLFSAAKMLVAHARTLILAAASASDCARYDEAATLLALARELARRCGARHEYENARRHQRRLDRLVKNAEAASEPGDVAALLTAREIEIARMAGKGERTKDIAEALSLSPRTVDVHLTNIYRKLGIKSRAALANRLFRATGPAGA